MKTPRWFSLGFSLLFASLMVGSAVAQESDQVGPGYLSSSNAHVKSKVSHLTPI